MAHRRKKTIPKETQISVIAVLATARKKQGLSQRELPRRLDLHPMTIMRLELGRRDLTFVEFLEISSVLSEDPADVLRLALRSDGESP